MKSALLRSLAMLWLSLAPLAAVRAVPVNPPTPAPAWTLKDPYGKPVSLSDFKGKVVVLDFWATWCPPCKVEIPGYIKLQKKYADDGLVIVGISIDSDGNEVVKKFMAEYGINYPVVMADDSDVIAAYGDLSMFPTTFIIDREGKIRDKKLGKLPTAQYEQAILAVLKPAK
jgi:peroxiredoxin